jgi:Zn-dependent peptidase ImmA (M78 family)
MNRVEVKPELLRWARERAGLSADDLAGRFPRIEAWEEGDVHPTLKQLERFAKATFIPVGYLFLEEPPVERVPIPDFRTVAGAPAGHPSPDLLDTIYLCQQRQDWYRDFARSLGEPPHPFVGSARLGDDIETVATAIRQTLGFDVEERRRLPTWTEALRRFIAQADAIGVLVMVSGVVGNNTRRHLDPDEFRGFALADPLAPVVFVNGADTKAAQMFTLAHELAHVWLGQSAVSDAQAVALSDHETERWCNRVAAELLVPLDLLRSEYDRTAELRSELGRLAKYFKVSTLVVLRRIHDAGGLTRSGLWAAYDQELARLRGMTRSGGGGDFYRSVPARVSRRLARALVVSTLEGRTSFTESFRLLGVKKMATFRELGSSLGVGF